MNQYMSLQDYLDESYASPGIKRAIHQVMGIVNELEGILKCPPKRVFVEVAREHGEKGKRTISRKMNCWHCIRSAVKSVMSYSNSFRTNRKEIFAEISCICTTRKKAGVCIAESRSI